MTCHNPRCGRQIGPNEEFVIQDRTGRRFCLDCADYYQDVTTVEARGCSCSRGGNARFCECRGYDREQAADIGRQQLQADAYERALAREEGR